MALVALAFAVAPSARAAADPPTVGVGCSDAGFWETTVTASPGDTFILEGAGGALTTCTLTLGSTATASSTSFTGSQSVTVTVLRAGTISVTTSIMPNDSPTLTIVVPDSSGPTPPDVLQQVPLPDTDACDAVDDADLGWGTGVRGGWSRQWGEPWARGYVCGRTLHYAGGLGRWIAA